MPKNFPITKAQFRKWLNSHELTTIIGETDSAESCPLANALNELEPTSEGCSQWYVSTDTISAYKNLVPVYNKPLPSWAKLFVQLVDSSREDFIDTDTALAALGETD